jgi:hypothetical protein
MNEQLANSIMVVYNHFRGRITVKSDAAAAQLTKIYFDQNNPQQLAPNDLKREELKQLRTYLENLVKKYGDKK